MHEHNLNASPYMARNLPATHAEAGAVDHGNRLGLTSCDCSIVKNIKGMILRRKKEESKSTGETNKKENGTSSGIKFARRTSRTSSSVQPAI